MECENVIEYSYFDSFPFLFTLFMAVCVGCFFPKWLSSGFRKVDARVRTTDGTPSFFCVLAWSTHVQGVAPFEALPCIRDKKSSSYVQKCWKEKGGEGGGRGHARKGGTLHSTISNNQWNTSQD